MAGADRPQYRRTAPVDVAVGSFSEQENASGQRSSRYLFRRLSSRQKRRDKAKGCERELADAAGPGIDCYFLV